MADISEYLRRQTVKGPKRRKRDGEARTLWNSPTAAAQDEAAENRTDDNKVQEKQLSPSRKTPSKKTSNNKTSDSKASNEKTSKVSSRDRKTRLDASTSERKKDHVIEAVEPSSALLAVEESIEDAVAGQIQSEEADLSFSGNADTLSALGDDDTPEEAISPDTRLFDHELLPVGRPGSRIIGASLADNLHDDFGDKEFSKTPFLVPEEPSTVDFSVITSPEATKPPAENLKALTPPSPTLNNSVGIAVGEATDESLKRVLPGPDALLSRGSIQPRSRPVTVGKAPTLPPAPEFADLSKDERFLAKYWLSPGPGGLPRSQERFFHFYRFLYSEAVRVGSARVYCTEEMAIEMLGPKARGTFTNYRKLGQQYGMFTVHVVGNLGRRDDCQPGTYFFLLFPWITQ